MKEKMLNSVFLQVFEVEYDPEKAGHQKQMQALIRVLQKMGIEI